MGIHPLTLLLFAVIMAVTGAIGIDRGSPVIAGVGAGAAFFVVLAFRVAKQWEKAVILRLGRFSCLKGPGIFGVIPIVETIPYWIDMRTVATPFAAEETLTKDSVPVDVDAILFWRVVDPKKAALEVENYRETILWASQTALRDVIGETDLAEILVGRRHIDASLCRLIDERSETWGIKALSVEIRDVKIPTGLQNAMSMQAQAERERKARLILADSECQIAETFRESAKSYENNPVALHLRAMNILLEGMRQNATVVIVPSSAVETMGLGTMPGVAALAKKNSPNAPVS